MLSSFRVDRRWVSQVSRTLLLLVAPCWGVAAQHYQITTFFIPPPPKNVPGTGPLGINATGTVVGYFGFHKGDYVFDQGFVRLPDGTLRYPIIDPNDKSGRFTYVYAVNDSGLMAGYYSAASDHGFLLNDGVFTDISEAQGGNTRIYGLNNSGDFCGTFGGQSPPEHGFISTAGVLEQVDIPGHAKTWVTSLGSDGASVGVAFPPASFYAVAFVRGPRGAVHIFQAKGAGARGTWPTGINTDARIIVGYYYDSSGGVHSFVFHYLKSLDSTGPLGSRAPAGAEPEEIELAEVRAAASGATTITGVNAGGVITGYWQDPNRSYASYGFIGTPVQ